MYEEGRGERRERGEEKERTKCIQEFPQPLFKIHEISYKESLTQNPKK
jgi:hypothetical protein